MLPARPRTLTSKQSEVLDSGLVEFGYHKCIEVAANNNNLADAHAQGNRHQQEYRLICTNVTNTYSICVLDYRVPLEGALESNYTKTYIISST